MKQCKADGCSNSVYSHLYCKYHQYFRRKRGGDLYQAKPKQQKAGSIPKESKKRKVERKRYTEVCDDLTAEIREQNNGKVYCFFSGNEILATRPHYHHLKSRTGDYYTDKKWLVPALDEYHVDGYHSKSVEWLLQQDWYTKVFLVNIRAKSEDLYQKEMKRQEKANYLFKDEEEGLF